MKGIVLIFMALCHIGLMVSCLVYMFLIFDPDNFFNKKFCYAGIAFIMFLFLNGVFLPRLWSIYKEFKPE